MEVTDRVNAAISVDHPALTHHSPQRGCTAAVIAAMSAHLDCLKALVTHGAKLNATNSDGVTVEALAAAAGEPHIADWYAPRIACHSCESVRSLLQGASGLRSRTYHTRRYNPCSLQ